MCHTIVNTFNTYFFIIKSGHPPKSKLFPYTTLFRSRAPPASTWMESHVPAAVASTWAPSRAAESLLPPSAAAMRSEEHTSELQSLRHLVCRLLLEKKKKK